MYDSWFLIIQCMTNPYILKRTLLSNITILKIIIFLNKNLKGHTLFSLYLERIPNSLLNLIAVFSRQKKNHFEA